MASSSSNLASRLGQVCTFPLPALQKMTSCVGPLVLFHLAYSCLGSLVPLSGSALKVTAQLSLQRAKGGGRPSGTVL